MEKLELKLKVDKIEKKEVESERGDYEGFTTVLKDEEDRIVTIKSPSKLNFRKGETVKVNIQSIQKTLDEELKEIKEGKK